MFGMRLRIYIHSCYIHTTRLLWLSLRLADEAPDRCLARVTDADWSNEHKMGPDDIILTRLMMYLLYPLPDLWALRYEAVRCGT